MRANNVITGERTDVKPLTSLRFVAVLLVFLDHAPVTKPFSDRYGLGQAAVGFFFVLSGFILTWTYHRTFAEHLTWTAARTFYVARFARIYPTLNAATALTAIVLFLSRTLDTNNRPLWVGIAWELSMMKSWFPIPAIAFGMNPPSWSIADEAFFYALFPVLASYLLRVLRRFSAMAVLAIGITVWGAFTAALVGQTNGWFMSYFPPVRLLDFTVGIIVAIAFLKGARLPFPMAIEYVAIFAATAMVAAIPFIPPSLRFALALLPFWGLLIAAFAQQRGRVSGLFSSPVLVRLGEVSFAFYLVHSTVIEAVVRIVGARNAEVLGISMAVSLMLSFALFHWVETPMRRLIRGTFAERYRPTGPNPGFAIDMAANQPGLAEAPCGQNVHAVHVTKDRTASIPKSHI